MQAHSMHGEYAASLSMYEGYANRASRRSSRAPATSHQNVFHGAGRPCRRGRRRRHGHRRDRRERRLGRCRGRCAGRPPAAPHIDVLHRCGQWQRHAVGRRRGATNCRRRRARRRRTGRRRALHGRRRTGRRRAGRRQAGRQRGGRGCQSGCHRRAGRWRGCWQGCSGARRRSAVGRAERACAQRRAAVAGAAAHEPAAAAGVLEAPGGRAWGWICHLPVPHRQR